LPYDQDLAWRIREVLSDEPGLTEKTMFGGLAFLIDGHMAVAASGQGGLLLRCDPEQTDALLAEPGAERFQMRGREMDGWLRISSEAVAGDEALARWVRGGVAYVRTLPPKRP
jgi:hypothetical protein